MANSLSISGGSDQVSVFPCPSCRNTIDTTAQQCRFCGAAIDPVAAAAAAKATSRVSQACNDASYLRIAAVTLLVFLGVMFIPFFGLVGVLGYWFLSIAIPVLTIRWWIKFGGIKTEDPDFPHARGTVIIIGILCAFPLIWDVFRVAGQ
jgi:hypothetical protein